MWLTGWSKRIKLTTDSTKIDADLTHFPITVFLKAGNGETTKVFQEVGANKLKIAIADDSNPPVEYKVEIELWDNVNQVGILHFGKAGEILPSTANKDYYLYYDNSHADNTANVGVIGSTAGQAVWDSNFKNVFHLPNETTSTVKDSTASAITGNKKAANEPIEIDGKVGKAQNFDGADDYIDVSSITSPVVAAGDPFSIESCLKLGILQTGFIFSDRDNANSRSDIGFMYRNENDGASNDKAMYFWANWNEAGVYSTTKPTTGTWYYVAAEAWGSNRKIYINGVDETNVINTLNTDPWEANKAIGKRPVTNSLYFAGTIDELRISNVVRTAAWIKATYNSLFDTLLTYGTEEVPLILGSATLSGIGSLSALGGFIIKGSALLSGIGNLTAIGEIFKLGKAVLSGIGNLVAKGVGIFSGRATLSGIGSLSALGRLTLRGSALLSGIGSLAAQGIKVIFGQVSILGKGLLSAKGAMIYIGKALISGIGNLNVIGKLKIRYFNKYTKQGDTYYNKYL